MDDKALYQAIANEMAANRLEPALWTQAYSEAGGDAEKAQAIYAEGVAAVANPGPHGFSEALYGFASAANNNGSAFAGLDAAGPFYATALGVCMFVGRYWVILPVLAIAGALARKQAVPPSAGTLPTDGPMFVALLAGTVVLIGALTLLPALALGPIAEHLLP